jgi:hypothetical protein
MRASLARRFEPGGRPLPVVAPFTLAEADFFARVVIYVVSIKVDHLVKSAIGFG